MDDLAGEDRCKKTRSPQQNTNSPYTRRSCVHMCARSVESIGICRRVCICVRRYVRFVCRVCVCVQVFAGLESSVCVCLWLMGVMDRPVGVGVSWTDRLAHRPDRTCLAQRPVGAPTRPNPFVSRTPRLGCTEVTLLILSSACVALSWLVLGKLDHLGFNVCHWHAQRSLARSRVRRTPTYVRTSRHAFATESGYEPLGGCSRVTFSLGAFRFVRCSQSLLRRD